MYGNSIDEPIMMVSGGVYFYVQDHLYSTAALVDASGTPQERYEYDAYGQVHILDANFADDADGVSDCGNPYMFTGRRVDFLDGGKLTLQINRHRYYDYYTGRWLTQDPFGITPAGQRPNLFRPAYQFSDGLNLFEYAESNPILRSDPQGLFLGIARVRAWFCKKCCPNKCFPLGSTKNHEVKSMRIVAAGEDPDYYGGLERSLQWVGAHSVLGPRGAKLVGKAVLGWAEEKLFHIYFRIKYKRCSVGWCCGICKRAEWKKRKKWHKCMVKGYECPLCDIGTYQPSYLSEEETGDLVFECKKEVEEAYGVASE